MFVFVGRYISSQLYGSSMSCFLVDSGLIILWRLYLLVTYYVRAWLEIGCVQNWEFSSIFFWIDDETLLSRWLIYTNSAFVEWAVSRRHVLIFVFQVCDSGYQFSKIPPKNSIQNLFENKFGLLLFLWSIFFTNRTAGFF